MAKSAKEQLNADKKEKKVILNNNFAGIKEGQKLYVATPKIVDAYIKNIPQGEHRTIQTMRDELATAKGCDGTCPVSTAIFIRISAQAAIDEMDAGKDVSDITPF